MVTVRGWLGPEERARIVAARRAAISRPYAGGS